MASDSRLSALTCPQVNTGLWFLEGRPRTEIAFLLTYIKGTRYRADRSLSVLTLVTWLRRRLSGFCKLLFLLVFVSLEGSCCAQCRPERWRATLYSPGSGIPTHVLEKSFHSGHLLYLPSVLLLSFLPTPQVETSILSTSIQCPVLLSLGERLLRGMCLEGLMVPEGKEAFKPPNEVIP